MTTAMNVARFERFFRLAAGLDIDKAANRMLSHLLNSARASQTV